MDSGEMTKEEFIDNALIEPGRRCSLPYMVNDDMKNDGGLYHKVVAWLDLQAVELRARAITAWNNWNRPWGVG